jgi:GAF domain-containing protein
MSLLDAWSVLVTQFDGELLHFGAARGARPDTEQFLRNLYPTRPEAAAFAGRCVLKRSAINISDALTDRSPQNRDRARLRGFRAALSVPMLRDGEPIGVITVSRREAGAFAANEVELLQTFADQAVIAIENVRLFEEVQAKTRDLMESLEQQTATSEVLQVISSSPGELQQVFKSMLINALRICNAKFGNMLLFNGEGFTLAEMHNAPAAYAELYKNGPLCPGPHTGLGRLMATKQVVHIVDVQAASDAQSDPLRVATIQILQARSFLAVPMLKERELVGAIVIYRQEVRPFSTKEIELVASFASQAIIAIENTRLLKELRERTNDLSESLQQQTTTADVLKVISRSAFDLQPVFDTVAENSARLCEADRAFIYRFDGELLRLAASYNAPPDFERWIAQNPMRLGRYSGSARAGLERRTIHIQDVRTDPEYTFGAKDAEAIRTILGVPILKGDELLGVMMIYHLQVKPFTDRQIALVETFADQAAIAIENVRLFREVQLRTDDLAESLQQQTATAEVLKVISRSTFDLQTVLDTLLTSAARLCQADHSFIFLREGDAYRFAAGSGGILEWVEYLKQQSIRPGRGTVAARAVLEARTVHIPDVLDDPEYTFLEAQKRGRFRTALGVPLLREGVSIGVMVLTRPIVRPFDDGHITLVTTFADQAVIAIENIRLFESVEARTRELSQSLDDLRTAQDRLVQTEKLASLGQLTAGIAHEIKNPLNFVNNFSALSAELTDELNDALKPVAMDGKVRGEVDELTGLLKDNLKKVVQHGKRADSIVKNMLLHSREGSREHRPADINSLLDESLNLAYHGARAEKGEFNVTLQRDFDADAGTIELFPQEITRAFLNLIANGVYAATRRKTEDKESGFEPTLRATTKNLGSTVEIRFRDNGTGISAEVQQKMFNPFFTTKPAGEGTGLGLSMTHDIIVKQHGGRIDVATEAGRFTEFTIVLPRKSNLSGKDRGKT